MNIFNVVIKELFERSGQLWMSVIAVSLGIAVMVAAVSLTRSAEKAIADELGTLGATVLILPKNASVRDYYSADLQPSTIPEWYVSALTDSGTLGIANISAKLSVPIELQGRTTILTGIMPKSDMVPVKTAVHDSSSLFPQPEWSVFPSETTLSSLSLRPVDEIGSDNVMAGNDLATSLKLKKGDMVEVLGKRLTVETVLPATGTVDDGRLFARLSTVQELTGKPGRIGCIEIAGCTAAAEFIGDIETRLPEARTVTVRHLIAAQEGIAAFMRRMAVALTIMMALVGGAVIADFMFANVYGRRREIGVFASLGASSGWIARLFLLKALIVGFAGGLLGYIAGTILAMAFGKAIAEVPVQPIVALAPWSLLAAMLIALAASVLPAMRASAIDPSALMKEE
jgi:putative ABC transport system permease protein